MVGILKVVSLLPSATEIVYALGRQDDLCAVSCDCDYPVDVANKAVVSSKVLPIEASTPPGEIDRLVREQLDSSDSIYSIDRSLIQELRPDVILAQDLCRVCAVPSGHVEEALDVIGCRAEVLSLDPHTLDDVLDNIILVGDTLGASSEATLIVTALRSRLDRIRELTTEAPQKRVVALEWQDPPFNGGHWIPEMIEIAGGMDLLGSTGSYSKTVTWAEVETAAPEVIVYMPCGYDLADAVQQARDLFQIEALTRTPAARNGQVFATDSAAYFSRSGPRLVDGVEILAAIFHPELFPQLPEGKARRVGPDGSDRIAGGGIPKPS